MKRNLKTPAPPKDTPATRKRRLQARLQELSAKSEQELSNLKKSVDKLRSAFKSEKTL